MSQLSTRRRDDELAQLDDVDEYDELQRLALLAGVPANQPPDELRDAIEAKTTR